MSSVRNGSRLSIATVAALASVWMLGATPVIAQESAEHTAAGEPAATTLEEVIVTAQKRAQSLQDVPFAISAISAAQIEDRRIDNVLNLKSLAPNLMVSRYPNSNVVTQISIRGGVTINGAMYWEPSTGLYLDGVYLGKAVGSVFDVVDLERIEVLRGPQGTLYGRNTMSGAINFITRKPTGVFDGHASFEVGNYGRHVEKLSVDLPRIGIARMSFGVRSETQDGFVKLTTSRAGMPGSPGTQLDSRGKFGARFALGLDFSDDFLAEYQFDYTDVDQTTPFSQLYRVIPASAFPVLQPLFQAAAAYASTTRLRTASTDWPAWEKLKLKGHALTLEWKLNESNTIKSITSYRSLLNDDSVDLDGTPLNIATANRISDFDQKSEELQWIGHTGRLNYVGGLYYYKDDGYTWNPHRFFFGTDSSEYGFGTKAKAAYTQLDFGITDALTLTAGVRWTDEKKHTLRYKTASYAPTLGPIGAEKSFSDTTPMASVSYKVTDALNLYVRYAQGFKSGGFQGEAGSAVEAVTPFGPEKQQTWEGGAKFASSSGHLQLNAAVFHNDIKDMQVARFTGLPGVSVIRNAGKARTQGVELEGIWLPIDALRLQLSYGYLDGKWIEFMEAPAPAQPITNVAGNRAFPHAPKHTVSLLADARFARTDWGVVRGTADYNYTASFYAYPYQLVTVDPTRATAGNTQVKGNGLLNLRLTLDEIPLGKGTGEFALWTRNVTNRQPPVNFIDFGPGTFANYILAYFQEPRTWGATFSYRW